MVYKVRYSLWNFNVIMYLQVLVELLRLLKLCFSERDETAEENGGILADASVSYFSV